MAESSFDKILEKLPYSDGSLRRRFVAGGIVLIGLTAIGIVPIEAVTSKIGVKEFFTSPVVTFGLLLLVYAIGNIVDLIGEVFFLRAASGVFWAISFPMRRFRNKPRVLCWIGRILLWFFVVPYLIYFNLLKGLLGYTSYRMQLESHLSKRAEELLNSLPEKVALGLREPIGDYADIAWKHLIDQFGSEDDQRWGRRFITRAKDVLAVTTALIIIFSGFFFTSPTIDKELLVNGRSLKGETQTSVPSEEYLGQKDIGVRAEFDVRREVVIKRGVVTSFVIFSFYALTMLLYIAFFITIRNAIVSILEILAIKRSPPSNGQLC